MSIAVSFMIPCVGSLSTPDWFDVTSTRWIRK